jgi:serine/threonine protein phosphatase PrpC
MQVLVRARSDAGMVRDHNEDSFLVEPALGLFAVADGMGGHAAGEVASRLALDAVSRALEDRLEDDEPPDVLALAGATAAVHAVHAAATADPSLKSMGTTLTVLVVGRNARGAVAHVGDSRLYRLRDHRLAQITSDHTYVEEFAKAGIADRETLKKGTWGHALTQAVGHGLDIEVEVVPLDLRPGDRYLLCTDGLHDHVHSDRDLLIDLEGSDLDSASENLVDFANASGGHDNITVVLVDVLPDPTETVRSKSERLMLSLRRSSD